MTQPMIYLDHAATTPLRPEARAAMDPYLSERFGNAASTHAAGRAARAALEESRERVAALLGAERAEITFTGGGTEADNLAVLGRWRATGGGVAVSAVEHSAVLEAGAQAAREGASLTLLSVDEGGTVDLDALREALDVPHAVVSTMWGNNEVGTVQPVAAIAELCGERGTTFHTDAVQAVSHVPVSVAAIPCDLLSISAHKFGGPQGVGALFVRRGTTLSPLILGGGQEGGLRAGTANVAGAVGLAEALEHATAGVTAEAARLAMLRDRLERRLLETVEGLAVNGAKAAESRLPHILNVGLDGVDPDVLLPALDLAGLAVSSGSACHTGAAAPSHVLFAMGVARDTVIRFSLGWTTTQQEVDAAARTFAGVVRRVRPVAADRGVS
jgi:cysteine desulfurase